MPPWCLAALIHTLCTPAPLASSPPDSSSAAPGPFSPGHHTASSFARPHPLHWDFSSWLQSPLDPCLDFVGSFLSSFPKGSYPPPTWTSHSHADPGPCPTPPAQAPLRASSSLTTSSRASRPWTLSPSLSPDALIPPYQAHLGFLPFLCIISSSPTTAVCKQILCPGVAYCLLPASHRLHLPTQDHPARPQGRRPSLRPLCFMIPISTHAGSVVLLPWKETFPPATPHTGPGLWFPHSTQKERVVSALAGLVSPSQGSFPGLSPSALP